MRRIANTLLGKPSWVVNLILFAILLGAFGGLTMMVITPLLDTGDSEVNDRVVISETPHLAQVATSTHAASVPPDLAQVTSSTHAPSVLSDVTPFTNIAPRALKNGSDQWANQVWNYRPGVVVFDYDRDGDLDFYITAEEGYPNFLYRNEGHALFVNVAGSAGVEALNSNSSGAVACDFDNDGYQDLYVGARGVGGSRLDYRSAIGDSDLATQSRATISDRLFVNNRDKTFTEITDSAFGDDINLRSAASIACADVDGDGWLDIYVGNLISEDFRNFTSPNHPGHYNVLYRNNGDLTFTDVSQEAGVKGPPILLRYPDGRPVLFDDPATGERYEGYDPTVTDMLGNRVGEPTGQTHAVLFFDYDDDGDPDLWVANDGDRLHVFRNDSSIGNMKFVSVAEAMGIDTVGAWMGFAVGDYDGDNDLDVFVTNIGFHPLLDEPPEDPSGICSYATRFEWGTCAHFLLRNDGIHEIPDVGKVGNFHDVAMSIKVVPSPLMPPRSLDPSNIHRDQEVPTGLAAYDFGFGATFFDFDNDGDEDLYWLGSTIARGQGRGGDIFPAAGRMLRSDGHGSLEDITVRAHLLDIQDFNYSSIDPEDPNITTRLTQLLVAFHENGKGLAHGDFNGDGYVDLIATNSSGPVVYDYEVEKLRGPIFLWLNGGGGHHWITLNLTGRTVIDGTGSNADGIGARVYVKTTLPGETEPLTQVREVRAGSSYLSMDSIDLEFGLGTASVVDEITILWPSGRKQVLNDVSVDQVIGITEPQQ